MESIILYQVITWENYYPSPDNSVGTFLTKEEAERFIKEDKDTYWYPNTRILELEVK